MEQRLRFDNYASTTISTLSVLTAKGVAPNEWTAKQLAVRRFSTESCRITSANESEGLALPRGERNWPSVGSLSRECLRGILVQRLDGTFLSTLIQFVSAPAERAFAVESTCFRFENVNNTMYTILIYW